MLYYDSILVYVLKSVRVGSVINYILCMLACMCILAICKTKKKRKKKKVYNTNFDLLLVGMHGGLFVRLSSRET